MSTLTATQIDRFVAEGFVLVAGAFPRPLADACRSILWRMTGWSPDDPSTWTSPVVRIDRCDEAPFVQAANTDRLIKSASQPVGVGRWVPRTNLGTFPIRFPHPDPPQDTGWHMEGSYSPEGQTKYWLNLRSRDRALLMLFLFSDVGANDAPTRIKAGSHLDVPAFLAPAGDVGVDNLELCWTMNEAGRLDAPTRPVTLATGSAGDVYLCHPFLIHGAQPLNSQQPRFIAQPPLTPTGLLELDRSDWAYSPVEIAVRLGLKASSSSI